MPRQRITSRTNPRIREAVRLRDRRHRERQGQFLVEGRRELARALAAGIAFERAFVLPATDVDAELQNLCQQLSRRGTPLLEVAPAVMRKLAFGQRNEGLLGVARCPATPLASLPAADESLVVVVDGVEKPGNLGALLRTADAAGVGAVVAVGPGTDLYNPAVVRASLGAVFTVPCSAATATAALTWLRHRGRPIYAARLDPTARRYDGVDFRQGVSLILGSEAHGVSSDWQAEDVTSLYIPMRGEVDSLNVAAAAAVFFYEAARQRDR